MYRGKRERGGSRDGSRSILSQREPAETCTGGRMRALVGSVAGPRVAHPDEGCTAGPLHPSSTKFFPLLARSSSSPHVMPSRRRILAGAAGSATVHTGCRSRILLLPHRRGRSRPRSHPPLPALRSAPSAATATAAMHSTAGWRRGRPSSSSAEPTSSSPHPPPPNSTDAAGYFWSMIALVSPDDRSIAHCNPDTAFSTPRQ
uniref:Uncharacterized protein n=1 Tax=Oryza nivara TaxID=4536 RepID=A0A0E0H2L6_ORYNI